MDILVLNNNDLNTFSKLINVFEEVFEMENFLISDDVHLKNLLKKDDFFAIVARNDEEVIGGLTVYVLHQYYAKKPLAYNYDLAVLNQYQRKGIGRKLISFTASFCREKGFEEVFVQADRTDEYAVDF